MLCTLKNLSLEFCEKHTYDKRRLFLTENMSSIPTDLNFYNVLTFSEKLQSFRYHNLFTLKFLMSLLSWSRSKTSSSATFFFFWSLTRSLLVQDILILTYGFRSSWPLGLEISLYRSFESRLPSKRFRALHFYPLPRISSCRTSWSKTIYTGPLDFGRLFPVF